MTNINDGAKLFLGYPIQFEDVCGIHPPTVGDVLFMDKFSTYRAVLTMTQEDIEDQLFPNQKIDEKVPLPTPFQYIMDCCQDFRFKQTFEEAFEFFTKGKCKIDLEEQVIFVGDLEEALLSAASLDDIKVINDDNYFDFQNTIRRSVGEEPRENYLVEKHIRIRMMKAKARYRDKVKAKQGGITLEDSLTSICCMGIGINPLNIREISYASVNKIMSKFQQKERYDIDIRSLIAGADSKKVKPQYWMNKLQDK